jgi:hypothetical protein
MFLVSSLWLQNAGAMGERWTTPRSVRIFASECGTFGFRVVTKSWGRRDANAEGTLFCYDEHGAEEVRWRSELRSIPLRVLVGPEGDVVCIDEYAHLGYDHALVVYSRDGEVVVDYKLGDLLSEREIRKNVQQSVSSRDWALDAVFRFEGRALQVRLSWGKRFSVDLRTGEVKK